MAYLRFSYLKDCTPGQVIYHNFIPDFYKVNYKLKSNNLHSNI